MMKEVCAQCLQRHVNPHTGEEFFVFSCFNQDQHLDFVDFKNLNERLRANSIQEKLTNMWLDRAFGRDEFKKLVRADEFVLSFAHCGALGREQHLAVGDHRKVHPPHQLYKARFGQ